MSRLVSDASNDVMSANVEYFDYVNRSENILLSEAFIILDYICLFRQAKIAVIDDEIKSKLTAEILKYQEKIQRGSYNQQVVENAVYCICAAVDEAVLVNLESIENSWAEETLLCRFFNDTFGGEKVFEIYESANLEANDDLIELIYMLISLGFTGKYFDSNIELPSVRKELTTGHYPLLKGFDMLIQPISAYYYSLSQNISSMIISVIGLFVFCGLINFGLWYNFKHEIATIDQLKESLSEVENA